MVKEHMEKLTDQKLPSMYESLILTGIRQVQISPAGGQHPGVDSRNNVGLVHDEVYDIVVCSQLTLQAT